MASLWDNPIFNTVAGIATGGLYTLGRAGADLAFNGGKGTEQFINDAGKGIEGVAGAFGMNPQKVPGVPINAAAAQMPGYDDWRTKLAAGAGASAMRAGPTIDTGPQSQIRGDQQALSGMLMDQALGRGPSIANEQLRQGAQQNLSQAMALGASQRGTARGGQLRGIANQHAAIGQQMASDAAVLRLQEQMAARNALSGHLGGMRGQDLGLASEQARVSLAQTGMNDDLVKFYTSQDLGLDAAQRAANMEMERMRVQEGQAQRDLQFGANNDAVNKRWAGVKGAADMISSFALPGGPK